MASSTDLCPSACRIEIWITVSPPLGGRAAMSEPVSGAGRTSSERERSSELAEMAAQSCKPNAVMSHILLSSPINFPFARLYVSTGTAWTAIYLWYIRSPAHILLLGHQKEHPAYKDWVTRRWCGYLSGARCRLFAYGPADATASQNFINSRLI